MSMLQNSQQTADFTTLPPNLNLSVIRSLKSRSGTSESEIKAQSSNISSGGMTPTAAGVIKLANPSLLPVAELVADIESKEAVDQGKEDAAAASRLAIKITEANSIYQSQSFSAPVNARKLSAANQRPSTLSTQGEEISKKVEAENKKILASTTQVAPKAPSKKGRERVTPVDDLFSNQEPQNVKTRDWKSTLARVAAFIGGALLGFAGMTAAMAVAMTPVGWALLGTGAALAIGSIAYSGYHEGAKAAGDAVALAFAGIIVGGVAAIGGEIAMAFMKPF